MRYASGMRRAAALAALLLVGCTEAPTDETPSGTVRLFLAAMARSRSDPSALQEAYRLLSGSGASSSPGR